MRPPEPFLEPIDVLILALALLVLVIRELRLSCLLSRQGCATLLGVSLRTVRYWDAGRSRVPWSAVRLLRIIRLGDLGALDDTWAGWSINRNGLWSPDGRQFRTEWMQRWWITLEQARFWREAYDRETLRGAGAQPLRGREAVPLLIGATVEAEPVGTPPPPSPEAVPYSATRPTAFAHAGAAAGAAVGIAVGGLSVSERLKVKAAARSDAGLVILSTSGTRMAQALELRGFRRAHGR
jgi:hypothetical protein